MKGTLWKGEVILGEVNSERGDGIPESAQLLFMVDDSHDSHI